MRWRNLFFTKVLSSLILSIFLFTDITYSQEFIDTLSAPKNILQRPVGENYSAEDQFFPEGPSDREQFKQSARQDMKSIVMAIFFLERVRPWELSLDQEKAEIAFEKRIIEAINMLKPLSEDSEGKELLQIWMETKNIKRIGEKKEGMEIPFERFEIQIFPKKANVEHEKKGFEELGEYYFKIVKREIKDLKGKEAPETDPIIRDLIEKGKIIEVFLDEESQSLKAQRVKWIEDYAPGEIRQDQYLRQEINIDQLFSKDEEKNLIAWMRAHKVRRVPAKFRIVLGAAAIGWKDTSEHSNISHAGVRDKAIYLGHLFLKQLMRDEHENLRKKHIRRR